MSLKNTLGAVLLIVGTSVGAAVLALPVATAELGFIGTTLMYILCWFFMTIGALCVLAANLAVGYGTNMISMSEFFLGKFGKWATWAIYLILFYALTASYLTGASSWVMQGLGFFGIMISAHHCAIIATLLIMGIIFCGTHITDLTNRLLMLGLFAVFLLLSATTLPEVNLNLLTASDTTIQLRALPIIITAFGYAIIVPTLANYLKGESKRLFNVVLWGSFIPLLMYIFWEMLILGTLPLEGPISLKAISISGNPVTELPKQLSHRFQLPSITLAMSYFSVFALFTSILGVCLSLFDFLADGFHIKKNIKGKMLLSAITFAPPLIFVYFYPKGFIFALSFAGIFVSLLLGILPALMVWRLPNKMTLSHAGFGWVRHKGVLILTISFFVLVIVLELMNLYDYF